MQSCIILVVAEVLRSPDRDVDILSSLLRLLLLSRDQEVAHEILASAEDLQEVGCTVTRLAPKLSSLPGLLVLGVTSVRGEEILRRLLVFIILIGAADEYRIRTDVRAHRRFGISTAVDLLSLRDRLRCDLVDELIVVFRKLDHHLVRELVCTAIGQT